MYSSKRICVSDLMGILLPFLIFASSLNAQNLRPGHSITSRSKQFVITSSVGGRAQPNIGKSKPIPDLIQLTPASLATFASSVRVQWARQFEINQQWQGRIYLHIVAGKLGDTPFANPFCTTSKSVCCFFLAITLI